MIFPPANRNRQEILRPIITPASRLRRDNSRDRDLQAFCVMGDHWKGDSCTVEGGEAVVKSERTFGGLLTIGIKFYLYRWIVLISQEGGDPLDRVWQSQFWDAEDEIRFVENPSISPPFLLSVALTKMGQHPAFSGSSASSPPQAPTAATTCHGQCAATDRVPS